MPCFVQRLLTVVAGDAVVEEGSHMYGLTPVHVLEAGVAQEAADHGEDHLVEALSGAVVLRCV